MTTLCPAGHSSDSTDFCDVCGRLLAGAPPPPPPAAGTGGEPGPDTCPACGEPRSGRFCEECSYDFVSGAGPATASSVTDWTVVVSADRGYYDLVRSEGEPDGGGIPFPADHQDRSIPLSGGRIRIGRRSRSDRERPEIDLAGPPEDPGVSHRHAVLLAGQDGWAVQDLGSTNGTTINDGTEPIPPEASVPLADGDRIHLGAWTTLTLRATPGRKA